MPRGWGALPHDGAPLRRRLGAALLGSPAARLLCSRPTTCLSPAAAERSIRLYATKRGERPRIGVAGAACQVPVRQSRPTARSSRRR